MDFFAAEDQARRNTRWLLFWYLLILTLISLISSLLLMLLIPLFQGGQLMLSTDYLLRRVYVLDNWPVFAAVSAFVFSGAAINSWLKWRQFNRGGAAVAEQLGAKLIPANSGNPLHKRALNLVQEMAIAANMPVPPLYLLSDDTSINAFAAGIYPSDAVVTVTRGALERLTREQLQGVIAHEFSHILNGDMRLNLRLIILLHGIQFISLVGRALSPRNRRYSSSQRKNSGGILLLVGLALRLIGWLGTLFSRIVQAKISRQREYLADASAVQFTRNPHGIGGALQVIAHVKGRSYLRQDNLEEVAHLFFAPAIARMFGWYATHPPIEQRIKRILPEWDGRTLPGLPLQDENTHLPTADDPMPIENLSVSESVSHLALLLPGLSLGQQLSKPQHRQVEQLLDSLQNPLDATALLLAVLLLKQLPYSGSTEFTDLFDRISEPQKNLLNSQGLNALIATQLQRLQALAHINRLLLVELAMPALKQLSNKQANDLRLLMQAVAESDGHFSLFEKALIGLLENYLQTAQESIAQEGGIDRFNVFRPEIQLLFSYLVQQFVPTGDPRQDYRAALQQLMIGELPLLGLTDISDQQIDRALKKLGRLSWQRKGDLLQTMVSLVEKDGVLTTAEEELILVFALSLQAPLPRFTLQAHLAKAV